jgi:streptogramin lyase
MLNMKTPTNSSDLGSIATDQRGNVWFVGDSAPPAGTPQTGHGGGGIGKIEMLNVTSHTILNLVPTSPNSTFLTGIAIGSNGDVWFAGHASNSIGRIVAPYSNSTASISQISLNSINPNAFPWGLTIDQRGNLWFTEHIGNKVAFYDVAKNQFQEWPIPTPQSDSKFVALDQFGNVWFAEGSTPTLSNLGVLALQPSAIGLVTSGPDYYYQFATVGGIVAIGVGTVAFFIRHRKRAKELAGPAVKPQQKKAR